MLPLTANDDLLRSKQGIKRSKESSDEPGYMENIGFRNEVDEQSAGQFLSVVSADARHLELPPQSIDLIVTSPPYWRKRDYKLRYQIGQEATPEEYVANLMEALAQWRTCLRPSGSIFLNIGDTYDKCSLVDIPHRVLTAVREAGWLLRNRIIWVKTGGTPDPAKNRLANRHEYILHLTISLDYYYDLFAYRLLYGTGMNYGDVWLIDHQRSQSKHIAPFSAEIVERAITLACPVSVCTSCGQPRRRIVERTKELNPGRPQARRAMQLAREAGLTDDHIAAIQAVGISDAGKGRRIQVGAGRNAATIQKLAAEAKAILGGYFREFTFPLWRGDKWSACTCGTGFMPGVVCDPFMGTGQSLKVAWQMGRSAVGADLSPYSLREFSNIAAAMFI